jgi:hypothetical protein
MKGDGERGLDIKSEVWLNTRSTLTFLISAFVASVPLSCRPKTL